MLEPWNPWILRFRIDERENGYENQYIGNPFDWACIAACIFEIKNQIKHHIDDEDNLGSVQKT